jgi:hypothetical protein
MVLGSPFVPPHVKAVRTLCSRCRAPLCVDTAATLPPNGMCPACAAYFDRMRRGVSLGAYLDMFELPVLVCDGDGKVVAVNSAMAARTGEEAAGSACGTQFGSVVACERSRLPGGCGKTIHCRDCTIRRMVSEVSRTRLARTRVPAYLQTEDGRRELCVTVRPAPDQAVEVVLEDAPPPEA